MEAVAGVVDEDDEDKGHGEGEGEDEDDNRFIDTALYRKR